jgi:hypothetical protein
MYLGPQSVIPDFLPTIYDPDRDDHNPEHPEHWANAWTRTLGFYPAGLRNDNGEHLADALELQVAERTIVRHNRASFGEPPEVVEAFRFVDSSGIVVLPDFWLPVSPDGMTQRGRCEWIHEDRIALGLGY